MFMKNLKKGALTLLVVSAIFFASCSSSAGSSGGTDGSETVTGQTGSTGSGLSGSGETGSTDQNDSGEDNPPTVTYIGTKAPTVAKEVGDIVFNDGSAMAYTAFEALDDDDAKTAKKAAAIALIFYKGTGLNSGDDTTTSRTLGVGLKHNRSGLAWCTSAANAYRTKITTIQCLHDGSAGALTFTGDKDGSNNLEQIGTYLTSNSSSDDTVTEGNYPAFYFAKNYSTTATNLGTAYSSGWYLPSIAELFQIYANGKGANMVFDIDAASQALGGDSFGTSAYWSSSQDASDDGFAHLLWFNDGDWLGDYKGSNGSSYDYVCAIRAFN